MYSNKSMIFISIEISFYNRRNNLHEFIKRHEKIWFSKRFESNPNSYTKSIGFFFFERERDQRAERSKTMAFGFIIRFVRRIKGISKYETCVARLLTFFRLLSVFNASIGQLKCRRFTILSREMLYSRYLLQYRFLYIFHSYTECRSFHRRYQ